MNGASLIFFHSLKTLEELAWSPGLQGAQVRVELHRRREAVMPHSSCCYTMGRWPPHVFTCVFVCV